MNLTKLPYAAALAVLTVVYVAASRLGLTMAIVFPNVSSVWPASAIGLAALMVLGRKYWPAIFAGAFLVNLQYTVSHGQLGVGLCLLVSALIAGSNALEAVVGAWAAERWAGGVRAIETGTGVLKLAILCGALCTMISATISVPALHFAGTLPQGGAAAGWAIWWLGGAAGVFVWAPLILAWAVAPPQRFQGGPGEAAALAAVLAVSDWLIFWTQNRPIAFLVIPGVIWAALRFGTRGAGLAVIWLAVGAMAGTASGHGAFARGDAPTDMLILQCFLGTIALSTYAMAALVWERERAETGLRASLVQAQKMEAVGRLSGVVVHEFNNALTGISGLAEFIRLDSAAGSQAARDAADITAACGRGAAIAGRLLALSRECVAELQPVDLNALLVSRAKMLRLAVGAGVEVALSLDPAAPVLLASADALEQILLNLCVNARDAMAGSGKIELATRTATLLAPTILTHGTAAPGIYGVLSVADTGAGIPEDMRRKIFDPFFSTKKAGQGTGLGLAIISGIVEGHKGAIDLSSRPGATVFSLYLPVTSRAPAAAATPAPATASPRGGETVLIADDDEFVRGVLVRVLKPLGYDLLVAKDGEEALSLYAANTGKISLAILDVVMPKLNGDEVYARIAAKNRGFKVLFISGRATAAAEELIRGGKLDLLTKPFAIEKVPFLVREILDRR